MLHNKDADGGGRSFERNTQPGRRLRTHELDFPFLCEPVKLVLRYQHRRTCAKYECGAAAAYLLRCRRRVDMVREEWKGEGFGNLIMESHEAILRVDDFLQRQVDAS